MVRVRFAPSPTGPFSIGNARTALFNWLFAKREKGKFLLRIEDTDRERSKKKYEKEILTGLKWLGLNWDEKIIRQSERTEIYKKNLKNLLNDGRAYYCFCPPEQLEAERQSQLAEGLAPRYSGRCRNISYGEAKKRIEREKAVIRFKMPETNLNVDDLIRGRIVFKTALIGDIVIAKTLEKPLYNFAVVIDDADMEITHIIRGEDHLPNTPKQIMIQQALGLKPVRYAHLPLILGPDRKKLSKRYLDRSLLDYKKDGYLAEAVLNFLVLLGWHPLQDREVIKTEEMIMEFGLERVQKSGAIFNPEKLDWLNAQYIKHLENQKLLTELKPFLPKTWLKKGESFLLKLVELEKERLKKLSDFQNLAEFFFKLPDYQPDLLIWRGISKDNILKNLETLEKMIRGGLEDKIMTLAEKIGRGPVLWPLRVALSGQKASPGPMEIMEILGRKETLRRIAIALKKIKSN